MIETDSQRLLADIGSTYARFAIETAPNQLENVMALRCADYPDFFSAVRAYLDTLGDIWIHHAAVAISNPVDSDAVQMTNYHWHFSIEETRARLNLDTLLVVNDFTALAMALPYLKPEQRRQIGGGEADRSSVIGLVGPGTGLGVSALVPMDDGWLSLGAEGGHASFSPQDERELYLLQYAWKSFDHVSAERLVTGPGIELTYRALCERARKPAASIGAKEITRRGLRKACPICVETLDTFCGMLGTVAANVALTLGAHGGVYIGGSIPPRLGDYFDSSAFRQRFESKGRFSDFLAHIPTYVITSDTATFLGTSAILAAQLHKRARSGSIINKIRKLRATLTPSERLVADYALSQPHAMLTNPISEIAGSVRVSQPTVIRFCRTIGCVGLSDFKLKLAAGLTATIPVTHTQVTSSDSSQERGAKVFGNTASAILEASHQLDRVAIDQAVALLLKARRIEFFGVGNYGIVAQDAQYKFLRLGIATTAYTDTRLQLLAVNAMSAEDVLVVFSGNGKITELVEAVDKAVSKGAFVVAITEGQSPLAERATVAVEVDNMEDADIQIPMISRILHLLIIDTLAMGVAMSRSGSWPEEPGESTPVKAVVKSRRKAAKPKPNSARLKLHKPKKK
ncbi:MAG: glucokinase [Betaproteobacteria bacterium]|nr:glucokinase [Betaproteobacteria bacterium]